MKLSVHFLSPFDFQLSWNFLIRNFYFPICWKQFYCGLYFAVATVSQSLFRINDSKKISFSITYVLTLNCFYVNQNQLLPCRQMKRVVTDEACFHLPWSDFQNCPASCIQYDNQAHHEYRWNLVCSEPHYQEKQFLCLYEKRGIKLPWFC